jgi:hypothetical protein
MIMLKSCSTGVQQQSHFLSLPIYLYLSGDSQKMFHSSLILYIFFKILSNLFSTWIYMTKPKINQ